MSTGTHTSHSIPLLLLVNLIVQPQKKTYDLCMCNCPQMTNWNSYDDSTAALWKFSVAICHLWQLHSLTGTWQRLIPITCFKSIQMFINFVSLVTQWLQTNAKTLYRMKMLKRQVRNPVNRGEKFTFGCCYKISFSFCIFIEFRFTCLKHCSLALFYEESNALNCFF
jgi:hypothetical protein